MSSIEEKVKIRLLSGQSAHSIAKSLRKSASTIYSVRDRLIYYGELRQIPGTKNPICYEEPTQPDTHGIVNYGGGVRNYTHPAPRDGWIALHLSGSIIFKIRKVGNFDTIRDKRGFTVGYWESKVKNPQGATQYKGHVRLYGQDLTFTYRHGNRGAQSFAFYPKRIYMDPDFFTKERAESAILDRAELLAELLRLSGWRLSDPEKRGKMHYPLIDHGLIRHFDKDIHIEGGDCFVDCSGGEPELELSEGIEEEEAKVKLMANLPTRFLDVERSYSDLRQEGAEIRQLLSDILEIQKINALILSEQTKAESLKYQPIPPRGSIEEDNGGMYR